MASHNGITRIAVMATAIGTSAAFTATAVYASQKGMAAPSDLKTVINNLRTWIIGMLVALATLFLTVGGLRMLLAAGDPGEVSKAKEALKYAAIGYGIAALAPVLVEILKRIVGA
jgi:Na+-driven multidrug efflux pump